MSKPLLTSEPWEICPNTGNIVYNTHDHVIPEAPNLRAVIAKMGSLHELDCLSRSSVPINKKTDRRDTVKAYAHLIRTSPELLSALKGLLEFAQDFGPDRAGDNPPKATYSQWEPHFDKAILAIRKAENRD